MISRSEQVDEFSEPPSQTAGAEHCCKAVSVLLLIFLEEWKAFGPLRTAGSGKCNETLIKIRLVLCEVLYNCVRR